MNGNKVESLRGLLPKATGNCDQISHHLTRE